MDAELRDGGDMPAPCPETLPLCRAGLAWDTGGIPGEIPPCCGPRATQNCHKQGILSKGCAPKPQRSPATPLQGPQHPAGRPGAGSELGWPCHGRRPWGEGQTGEAGTGTMSPLVNSAGPCSLFKALNRGWYLSSAELEAGVVGAGLTRSDRVGRMGKGGRATPDGNMWGVSPVATCPSSPSRPPFIW